MELVSAEAAPPSAELAARLAEHGVEVRLSWDGAEVPQADLVVALTVLEGPSVSGIPCDDRGFLPVDEAGRVTGLDHVWAIGDAAARGAGPRVPVADQADALARALSAVSLAA